MRNFTLLTMMLILSAFLTKQVNAQVSDAATWFAKLITAQKYMNGDGLPQDTLKAFELYMDCAVNGKMPDAMARLGVMYKYGSGAPRDLDKAFYWFSQSAEKKNSYGMYHLGMMYKLGEAVPQDFEKAYGYFKASAEKGLPSGMYGVGYCAYKGLGTKQDYSEAAKWFTKGMEQNNAACLFMMAICKRNGFGVEQNELEATELLKKANEKKIAVAKTELAKQFPEIDGIEPTAKNNGATGGESSEKEKFRKLVKNQKDVSFDGTWGGTRYLYDWSGEHILHQAELQVSLKQTGTHITGEWFEDGGLIVKFKGTLIGDQVVIKGSRINGKDRYGKSVPMEFRYARFEAINADADYLAGNIDSYSPKTKEPGHPCYFVMSKLPKDSTSADTLQLKSIKLTASVNTGSMQREALDYFKEKDAMLSVFPNPFDNEINLSYQVTEEGEANLYIYNATGALVLQRMLDKQYVGSHLEKVPFETIPGQYIVRLVIGTKAYSKVIIKQ
ncbi:MAG: T9SS type A sorting domain-containing protein [Ignavibacteria bacterium]|nr:T9SS type A sorting domain-containing protein [Ignavibacteria bacterium]